MASRDLTPSRPIAALVVDLDGTLIATRRLYLEAFADALEPVYGRRPGHAEMMAHRPRAEIRFLRELTAHVLGMEDPALPQTQEAVLDRFFDAYRRRHLEDFEGVYEGVIPMLERTRRRGLPLGMVTGKSRRSWEITRPHVDLGEFGALVFDDDVPRSKPDPAGLRLALRALGTQPEETLYLGDSLTDLEAAVGAGMVPAAVLWSKRSHERESFRRAALEHGGLALATPEHVDALLDRSSSR